MYSLVLFQCHIDFVGSGNKLQQVFLAGKSKFTTHASQRQQLILGGSRVEFLEFSHRLLVEVHLSLEFGYFDFASVSFLLVSEISLEWSPSALLSYHPWLAGMGCVYEASGGG